MLCISNTTKHHLQFPYRLEKVRKGEPYSHPLQLVIPSGQQVNVGERWTAEQHAYMIEQLERYGARDAAESYGQMGQFHGLLYREAAPVSEDEIRLGHDAVVGTQEQRAVREAVRGALAFDRNSRKEVAKRRGRPAQITEVEVKQEVAPNSRPTGNEVAFSLSVDPDGRTDVKLPV